jgi:hypothetical protein
MGAKSEVCFLVLKAEFESFRNAAEELAQKMEQSGIRIELTGPGRLQLCKCLEDEFTF